VKSDFSQDVDRFAKRALARLVLKLAAPCPPVSSPPKTIRTVLILAQEKLGDAMLLMPLFALLKRGIPGVRIAVVIYGPAGECYSCNPNIDLVLHGKRNYPALFHKLRRFDADLLYNPKDHASFTFLYQSRLFPAQFRVGIEHPLHHGFFHHLIPLDFHKHMALKNCALLDFLGISYSEEDCRPMLPGGPVSEDIARFAKTLPPGTIGVNLSAGEPCREWPVEKWTAFLSAVKRTAVVFAMPDRLQDKKQIESAFPFILPSPMTRSIDDVGAILERLGLLVTPDTSFIHAASAVKVPVVGLYRADPVHIERFGPFRIPHRQVLSDTGSVADITVESVLSAVKDLDATKE
jgi:heptosyltransferase III